MSTATTPLDGSVQSDVQYFYSCEDSTLTDTIAAIVSAIMAVVFVVLIVCIVQAIKKRRQQQQSNRLRHPIVHTVAPGVFHSDLATSRNVLGSNRGRQQNGRPAILNQQSQYHNVPSTSRASHYTLSASSSASVPQSGDAVALQLPLPSTALSAASRNNR
ncbi:hypothetical protein BsWGS_15627 [Bradybaena similaris]